MMRKYKNCKIFTKISKIINKRKKIKECLKYYSNRDNVTSYAIIEHMKTISKLSIIKPINEYDYINKLKLSDEKLEEITNEIIKEYTI